MLMPAANPRVGRLSGFGVNPRKKVTSADAGVAVPRRPAAVSARTMMVRFMSCYFPTDGFAGDRRAAVPAPRGTGVCGSGNQAERHGLGRGAGVSQGPARET